jgi:hypothetical protein
MTDYRLQPDSGRIDIRGDEHVGALRLSRQVRGNLPLRLLRAPVGADDRSAIPGLLPFPRRPL